MNGYGKSTEEVEKLKRKGERDAYHLGVFMAAKELFDNRLMNRPGDGILQAPREFWIGLGVALFGDGDPAVERLRKGEVAPGKESSNDDGKD